MAHDLAAESWTLGPQAPGWPDGVYEAAATDWTAVLEQSAHQRAVAKTQAEDAAKRWKTAIREAMLAGVDARTLATLSGITVQRVYQMRDRRRRTEQKAHARRS